MDNHLYQAYGEFLSQFPWEWYCTLTFRSEISYRMAFKHFNEWKIQLKKASGQYIGYVLFIEPTRGRHNTPHIHSLLYGVAQEKPYIWQKRWFIGGGQAKIKPYNPQLGAVYYLGKKMERDGVDVLFSKNLRSLVVEELNDSKEDPVTVSS
jgi:hypothetical protein